MRVADVLAAILRRGLGGGALTSALRMLSDFYFRAYPYTLLGWTNDVPDPGRNPYEYVRDNP